jgi:ABC-2 type transport system permease protein
MPGSSWRVARSIFQKDMKIILRDRTALVFIFGLPIVFTLIFGTIFSNRGQQGGSPVRLLASNRDQGKYGGELLDSMRAVGLTVELETEGEAAATEKVRSGKRAVAVLIPPDFSAQLTKAARSQETPARLRLLVDPAQPEMAGMVKGAILAATNRTMAPLMRAAAMERIPEAFREMARQSMAQSSDSAPLALNVEPQSDPERTRNVSPGDLMIPGFAVYFVFFMANGVAATLLVERQEGTLRRMLSAPVSRGQILFGKLLARGLLGLLQTVILFVIGVVMLRLHLGSALPGVALTALTTIFAATGLGLLIASLGKTQEQIQGMTTLALLVMGLLSGCLYPRALMPEAMVKLSLITPHAWALNAYQDLILRHKPLGATLGNLAMVMAFGLGFFFLALKRFQYE